MSITKMTKAKKKHCINNAVDSVLMDTILEKSKLTEKDAVEIGKLIKKSIREQHNI